MTQRIHDLRDHVLVVVAVKADRRLAASHPGQRVDPLLSVNDPRLIASRRLPGDERADRKLKVDRVCEQ